ncbi:hypothetical protein DFJ58DRAFT_728872 [Suillus subalutaceus]|uniref:uncharacterized protein n=1 Tax=Suillus subalutaceus TaxID=48586 RepID=UPI001B874544|nr:uncharacterized protein DFJ58DRAFT_728872 [Suillus subalutaceus]KAG1851431.1 hypothetical protein DFJ58DRAFT_728872 [Suillus subalutaceus]
MTMEQLITSANQNATPSPLHKLLYKFKINPTQMENILPVHHYPKWEADVEICIARKEEAAEEDKLADEELRVYLDGSAIEGGVGAAAVLMQGEEVRDKLRFHLGKDSEHTVYEGEIIGMILAVELLRRAGGEGTMALGVDNQAVIHATKSFNSQPGHYIIRDPGIMPARCPSCGKEFKDHTSVACHMSQPRKDDPMVTDDPRELYTSSYETGEDMNVYDFSNEGETFERESGGRTQDRDAEVTNFFPKPPLAFEHGYMFLSLFESDENSVHRKTNLYYPFSSRREWQVAAWLLHSGLSMEKINSFLALEMIQDLHLSFHSARELQGRAESLPTGPRWKSQAIRTSHATKLPVILYWRDPIKCISNLFNHPLFHNHMDFASHKVYTTAQKLSQVYTKWMTADHAWEMQSALPHGATLLGTILSSDKTCITALTGDHIAHLLLLSIANIHMSTQLKSSSNTFVLTALLPVPKFIHKKKRMKGVLQDQLVHQCLDIVLEPLKVATQEGIMLSDPTEHSCYCFTLLASYIADTPEAMMLACVGGKTSPVTMAMYKQSGDALRHEPHTRATTLAQLDVVHSRADQDDVETFFRESQKFCLNCIAKPFWSDWVLADPDRFFTPESLHIIHKKFWDHDTQWLILAVGESEIDFRFSILQPTTGYQHFHKGISKLKQVTVCTDAAPPGVIVAVHAILHFHYLIQSPCINDDDIHHISAALDEFHANKDAIISAGVRQGEGRTVINNWCIPKLELMQSIVPSIHSSGVTGQWSADVTEHVHITEIKDPARSSNNNNYDPQICRHLDRTDKCNRFELATSLLDHVQSTEELQGSERNLLTRMMRLTVMWTILPQDYPPDLNDLDSHVLLRTTLRSPICSSKGKWDQCQSRYAPLLSDGPLFILLTDPSIKSVTLDEVAVKFGLPDLRPAMANFLHREVTYGNLVHPIGGPRRAGHNAKLPFDKVQVWFKICLQETEFYNIHSIRPTQTLNCAPPSNPWTLGCYDNVIIQTSAEHSWPASGLSGAFFLHLL